MIIKNVPSLLCPNYCPGGFFFDKSGRFIYILNDNHYGDAKTFFIYDTFFNTLIELNSDTKCKHPNGSGMDRIGVRSFLPVNTEYSLAVIQQYEDPLELMLIQFDLQNKGYKLLDTAFFPHSQQEALLVDGDRFLLLCAFDKVMDIDDPFYVFIVQEFKIEGDKLKLLQRRELDYEWERKFPQMVNLHFHRNKLWFNSWHKRRDLPDDSGYDFCISYFDLNEENPKETVIGKIEEDIPVGLQCVDDWLFFQASATTFRLFNLISLEWRTVEHSIEFPCTEELEQSDKEWLLFYPRFSDYYNYDHMLRFVCDQDLILTAIDCKQRELHRVPLRNPFKLTTLAWTCALNAGFVDKNTPISLFIQN